MIRSTIVSVSVLVMSAGVYAGDPSPELGASMSMPALAIIGAVGLIAGIKYLRNKRS